MGKKKNEKKKKDKKTKGNRLHEAVKTRQMPAAVVKEPDDPRQKMIVSFMKEKIYKPMKFRELCSFMQVPKAKRDEFKKQLDQLIRSGNVQLTPQGTYRIPRPDTFVGSFSATSRGFGFVTVEGMDGDIFIPADETKGAFHSDTVRVKVTKWNESDGGQGSRRNPEGCVTEIIERGMKEVTGVFQRSRNFGFVVPDNQKIGDDIYIPKSKCKGVVDDSKVVAKITDYGSARRNPEGEIVQVLGMADDPKTDLLSVIRTFGLPEDFPEDVKEELEHIPDAVLPQEMTGRKDLRELMTVTIDGEDAKDLDDAITLRKEGSLYKLGVHIADVSHYVREGSPLDREALKRGTSVYLINRVIPMLPQKLSNGICSLNEGQDRVGLSCLMDIDENGRVVGHEICETLIRVNHRMSYRQVAAILGGEDDFGGKYDDARAMLFRMKELSGMIRERRHERGGMDFNFPEAQIELDEHDFPVSIHPYEITVANKIIEDFMLMANETVANEYYWQELPFLYRSHETPDEDKIHRLGTLIRSYGYYLHEGRQRMHPMEFQKLLEKIDGSPEEAFISRLVLRSMKQAKYTTENLGHFGLAAKEYCHFTSPIRRYPDLQIHRIIKENLHGDLGADRQEHYRQILTQVAVNCSSLERRADDAEREIDKIKKCEYMSKRIGEVSEGMVSGITSWGIYVELPDTCEGLVRLETLMDYYIYDEEDCCLHGTDTGREFRLGDHVRIKVTDVDMAAKAVLFEMAEENSLGEFADGRE